MLGFYKLTKQTGNVTMLMAIVLAGAAALYALNSNMRTSNAMKSMKNHNLKGEQKKVAEIINRTIDCNATVYGPSQDACSTHDAELTLKSQWHDDSIRDLGGNTINVSGRLYNQIVPDANKTNIVWLVDSKCVDGNIVVKTAKYDKNLGKYLQDPLTKRTLDWSHGLSTIFPKESALCGEYYVSDGTQFLRTTPEDTGNQDNGGGSIGYDTDTPAGNYFTRSYDPHWCGQRSTQTECVTFHSVAELPISGSSQQSLTFGSAPLSIDRNTQGNRRDGFPSWAIYDSKVITADGDLLMLDFRIPYTYTGDGDPSAPFGASPNYSNYKNINNTSGYCSFNKSDNHFVMEFVGEVLNSSGTLVQATTIGLTSGSCQPIRSSLKRRLTIPVEAGKQYTINLRYFGHNYNSGMDEPWYPADKREEALKIEPNINMDDTFNPMTFGPVKVQMQSYQYTAPQ